MAGLPQERDTAVARLPQRRGTAMARLPQRRGTAVAGLPQRRGTAMAGLPQRRGTTEARPSRAAVVVAAAGPEATLDERDGWGCCYSDCVSQKSAPSMLSALGSNCGSRPSRC